MNEQALKQAIDRNDKGKAMAILQQNGSMLNKYCVLTFSSYLIACFNLFSFQIVLLLWFMVILKINSFHPSDSMNISLSLHNLEEKQINSFHPSDSMNISLSLHDLEREANKLIPSIRQYEYFTFTSWLRREANKLIPSIRKYEYFTFTSWFGKRRKQTHSIHQTVWIFDFHFMIWKEKQINSFHPSVCMNIPHFNNERQGQVMGLYLNRRH